MKASSRTKRAEQPAPNQISTSAAPCDTLRRHQTPFAGSVPLIPARRPPPGITMEVGHVMPPAIRVPHPQRRPMAIVRTVPDVTPHILPPHAPIPPGPMVVHLAIPVRITEPIPKRCLVRIQLVLLEFIKSVAPVGPAPSAGVVGAAADEHVGPLAGEEVGPEGPAAGAGACVAWEDEVVAAAAAG